MITVLYFASLKEKIGHKQEQIQFAGKTVDQLIDYIAKQYDRFPKDSLLVAVNEEYVLGNERLADGDTVAFIPPVSGG